MKKPYEGLHAILKRGKRILESDNEPYCSCSNCESFTKYKLSMEMRAILIICFIIFMFGALMTTCNPAHAQEIDIRRIAIIESSNNPNAYNKNNHAIGLCQITEPVLIEYNKHFFTNWTLLDLYNMDLNILVATWYFNDRIPQMLKHYRIKDTVENRIVAYNAGIRTLVKHRSLPTETKNYIKKYKNGV